MAGEFDIPASDTKSGRPIEFPLLLGTVGPHGLLREGNPTSDSGARKATTICGRTVAWADE